MHTHLMMAASEYDVLLQRGRQDVLRPRLNAQHCPAVARSGRSAGPAISFRLPRCCGGRGGRGSGILRKSNCPNP